jgi:hypothetical protein
MTIRAYGRAGLVLALACSAAACSSGNREDAWYNKNMVELVSGRTPEPVASGAPGGPVAGGAPGVPVASAPEPLRGMAADDLYRSEGSCGGMPLGASASGTPAGPIAGGAISLEMSECEFVKRAGPPDKVEIARSERGERALALTYSRADRHAIYRFLSGRLVSVESAPAPPPPAAKPAKPGKSRGRV